MTSATSVGKQSAAEPYTTGAVTSQDGTTIGYRQFGSGAAVVLVQGTMGTAHNFLELAEALADTFTIYVPDRRGRGISGAAGSTYSIQKEVEDLDALLAKTGAHNLFGLSSGAIIALQAALTLPAIRKLAIYEPPLFINGSLPAALVARYEQEMSQGNVAAALITGMQAGQFGPGIFKIMPRWLLELLTSMAIKSEDTKGSGGYAPMRELALTLHYDFQLVAAMSDMIETFSPIRAELLLLGGGESPAYLKTALAALHKLLPHAKRAELAGLGHAAPWNTDRGGRPESVAHELRRFFA